ncbi:gamma-glutamyltransferase family protein [Rivibacter subsaxonicus]|uniref:Gamma-glutamyltranspeptidase/glutathione hydrolase n=1 Tax=Rivibacter subsaxonicus TaxID=457575 RepID=A0A4Q7W1L9_9BURK|nr:gamma-glutamyltransferase family protein [Rivibacter subsaxonicus]RZU02735.1 gamma-glutamyltranspeptidase/glutathione hydrolase [Rivibacter subsaxonicus]
MKLDAGNPYASHRAPVFARDVVSTSHPLASQAGLAMLRAGGNAVDAAIAAAAVMTIVEPCSNGLGSDAFAILWDGRQLVGLNASGRAPSAWTPAWFRARHDASATAPPVRGWDSVTVPGAVAGWAALHGRYGRLRFEDLLAPAAEVAERGYAVTPIVQHKWAAAAQVEALASQPGFAEVFLPRGRAPTVGERFAMPGAARALRAIGATGGEAFYRGEIAAALAASAREHGAALAEADLAAYQPQWVDPIGTDTTGADGRRYTLHEIPPNGQGIAALIALAIANHLGLRELPADSPQAMHGLIEAMKLAFADVYRYVAEPGSMLLTPAQMLDPAYIAERARLVDMDRAQLFEAGNPQAVHRRGGTIYLSAADAGGMMVSFIQSNYMGFGSGVVLPDWGVSLQNRGHGFSLDPTSPNVVAPGKRPFHTIIPAFLSSEGQPIMSFGVMGANMQPQGHLQTLARMLWWGQSPQAACDAPRWRFNAGLELNVEATMPAATVEGLVARGHRIDTLADSYQDFGAGQFIWRLGDPAVDGYVAASDPRRDGLAAGW